MKTEACPLNSPELTHQPHSWSSENFSEYLLDESRHDRFCRGIEAPVPSIIRLHRVIGVPYKLGTLKSGEDIITGIEYLVKSLRKQLRTRDRKITALSKENKALKRRLREHEQGWDALRRAAYSPDGAY